MSAPAPRGHAAVAAAGSPGQAQPMPLPLLVALYFVAGMPFGAFAELLPLYLRSCGASLQAVGFLSMLHLPYSCKVVWGPLVDRSGRSGRWLMAAALGVAAAYFALAQLDPQHHLQIFLAAALLLTFASSVYDVALDATFVRALSGAAAAREANYNAWRLASFKFAMVAVGSGCAVLAGAVGFAKVFWLLVAVHVALAVTGVGLRVRLPPGPQHNLALRPYFAGLWRWLSGAQVRRVFALVFFYKLSIASLLSLERAWWTDRGISLRQLGLTGAALGLLSTVAGAALGSTLAHRRGIGAMLRWGVVAQVLTALAYLGLTQLPACGTTLAVGLSLSGACFGLSTAALMSLITRLCRAPHAATQFAALTGTYSLTRSLGGAVAGTVAERFGFVVFFAAVAWLALPALLLLPHAEKTQRAWGLGEDREE